MIQLNRQNDAIGTANRANPAESGLCTLCRADCKGKCEAWLGSLVGRRLLYPRDFGTVTAGSYSVKWDTTSENVVWKIDVPGKGYSTPVVWDKKIFLTNGTDGLDTVLAFDWSGNRLWRQQFGPEVPASFLQEHGNVRVVLDRDSGGWLCP